MSDVNDLFVDDGISSRTRETPRREANVDTKTRKQLRMSACIFIRK
tara:strand:+ start:344 stop:481 length:138 start_codon:yes stop_codon:yes gene_type:complete